MPRRYEALDNIPEDLRFIQDRVNEADRLPPGHEARTASITAAGRRAQGMLTRLTESPPPWLALQRQFLVERWSFDDLKQLDGLQLQRLPLVRVLGELHDSLPAGGDHAAHDPEALVRGARERFGQVRDQAVENAKASGLILPEASAGIRRQVNDATVVDQAHERLQLLRQELAWLLLDAERLQRQPQADETLSQTEHKEQLRKSERRWQQVLKVCVEVMFVAAAITTVFVQAPEVWDEIQPLAGELVRMVGEVRDAISSQVALLGVVVALDQIDQALGPDPAGSIDQPTGPTGPLTGDHDQASVDKPPQVTEDTSPTRNLIDAYAEASVDSPQVSHGVSHETQKPSEAAPLVEFDPSEPAHPEVTHGPGWHGPAAPSGEELSRMATTPLPAEPPLDDDPSGRGPGDLSPGGSL